LSGGGGGPAGGSTYAGLPPVPRTIIAPAVVINGSTPRPLPAPAPLRVGSNRGSEAPRTARANGRKAVEKEGPAHAEAAKPVDPILAECPTEKAPEFGGVVAYPGGAAHFEIAPPPKADDFIAIIDPPGFDPIEGPPSRGKPFFTREFRGGKEHGRGFGHGAFAMGIKKHFSFKLLDDVDGDGDYGLAGLPPEVLEELRERAEHCPMLLTRLAERFPKFVSTLNEDFSPLSLQQVPEPGGLSLLCIAAVMTLRGRRKKRRE
jgi:hypothetical protein